LGRIEGICDMELLKEIGKLQANYNKLIREKRLTKKAMCELVIPFRDKYNLKDSDALKIARNEMSLSEMANLLIDGKTV